MAEPALERGSMRLPVYASACRMWCRWPQRARSLASRPSSIAPRRFVLPRPSTEGPGPSTASHTWKVKALQPLPPARKEPRGPPEVAERGAWVDRFGRPPSVPVMMVVATALEMDQAVVAMMVAAFVTVAMTVAVIMVMVVAPVMVVMSGPMVVPLRGRSSGQEHEGGSDQTCDSELHRMTFRFEDARSLGEAP